MSSLIPAARNRLLELGRWSVLLCLFAAPINKPATNIFIFLALLCAILGTGTRERFLAAVKHPVVIGSSAWFLILALSAFHAPGGSDRWEALGVYKALLYPFIVATLLETQQWRNRGLFAFALAAGVVLLISWAQFLGLAPMREIAETNVAFRYTVFKEYTQQGIQFLVLAVMALSFATVESSRTRRRLLWLVAALAFINVVFLLQSRTSYLIVAPLLLYWIWRLCVARFGGWRGGAAGLMLLALIGATALLTPRVQQRLTQAEQDVSLYASKREPTSMGIRLELWQRTLPIIGSAPLFGHGLGQWRHEYEAQTKGLPDFSAFMMGHPHQEMLYILSEEGIAGLAIFALLLLLLAKYIRRLDQPQRDFYASLLLIYITAGLANCLMIDFTHRHLFLMLLACIPLVPVAGNSRISDSKT